MEAAKTTLSAARTCPGHCCVAFYVSTPHDRVDEMRRQTRDGEQIAEMLIPLSLEDANERLERFGSDVIHGPENEGHVYTCRNFDESTRLCRIYDERPEMCRDYPYTRGGCDYDCGCEPTSDVVGKWSLLNAAPRRQCPAREPMSQR